MNTTIASANLPILDSQRRKKKDPKHTSPARKRALPIRAHDYSDNDIGRYQLRRLRNAWLVESALVLPEQFYEGRQWREQQLLMREVLLSALKDYDNGRNFPGSRHAVHLAREALQWITSPDYDWPFSFINICEALGVDADALRQWVFAGKVMFLRGARQISHS